jgi:hypothetical protein
MDSIYYLFHDESDRRLSFHSVFTDNSLADVIKIAYGI